MHLVPRIQWRDLRLHWLNADTFPDAHQQYLQDYLEKITCYRPAGFYQGSPVYSLYQTPPATPAGQRALAMRLRRKFCGERLPATATIAVNKACQCECTHCSAVDYNHSAIPDLDAVTLKSAIRETIDLGATHIILLGGEPLLRRDLCDIIAQADASRACVILFTNGEYLTQELCRNLKQSGLMGAFVSLDCADPAKHDSFRRRPGLFAKALQGIENLKSAGLLVGVSTHLSVSRMRENGFQEMMELGQRLGVNEVTFFDAIPSGRWIRDESELLQPEHRTAIAALVRESRTFEDMPAVSAQSTLTSECGSAFCFAANTQFYLSAAGAMCPCDFTPLTIGSYPQKSIRTLWEKMIGTQPYKRRAKSCRMQDVKFRSEYIFPHLERGESAPYLLKETVTK